MIRLSLVAISLCLLNSCSLFNRLNTVTKTETKILVDTLLHINLDGYKPMTDIKYLYDTAKVESKTGTAIAYVDPIKNEIVLSFLPKTFDVNLSFEATKTTEVKNYKKRDTIDFLINLLAAFALGAMCGAYLIARLNKKRYT